jgi:radical SAM superfamily enzyme YgiQ (UPF0313 family)
MRIFFSCAKSKSKADEIINLIVEPPRNTWFVMGEYLPPPSALLILAAYIERELPDVDIDIVDCQADHLDWKGLERYIESTNPSIVLTSGYTTNAYTCARTCEIAKIVNKEIVTIVGGIHFSSTPDESLKRFLEIDFIIILTLGLKIKGISVASPPGL